MTRPAGQESAVAILSPIAVERPAGDRSDVDATAQRRSPTRAVAHSASARVVPGRRVIEIAPRSMASMPNTASSSARCRFAACDF